jgi:hypothetical protein
VRAIGNAYNISIKKTSTEENTWQRDLGIDGRIICIRVLKWVLREKV